MLAHLFSSVQSSHLAKSLNKQREWQVASQAISWSSEFFCSFVLAVPPPGTEPMTLVLEARSLNHGTSREVAATFHLMTSPDTSLYPTIVPKVCRRATTELKAYALRSLLICLLALSQNL